MATTWPTIDVQGAATNWRLTLLALRKVIREEGISAILVEQKARKILGFTDQAIILDRGRIVFKGDSAALAGDAATLEAHLGVAEARPGAIPLH